ncbi:MAG: terminase family protein [Pseudomonadota bacterium]
MSLEHAPSHDDGHNVGGEPSQLVTPFTPLPWQQDWLTNKFALFPRNVIVAARRSGKSTLLVNTLLSCALRVPGIYGFGSPFLQQSKDIAEPMLRAAVADIPGCQWREQESRLILPNQSEIICFATARNQAQRARGMEMTGCVIDESAHADPETIDGILMPALASVEGSWLVLSGTPRGLDVLYDYAQRGWSNDPKYASWATTVVDVDQAGNLSAEAIAEMRASMSDSRVRRELYCDFSVSEDTALIDLADATEAAKRQAGFYSIGASKTQAKIVGVDCAREGKDRNVFMLRQGDVLVDMMSFSEAVNFHQVAGRLEMFMRKHIETWHDGIDAIVVDVAGMGGGLLDILSSRIKGPTELIGINGGKNAIDTDRFYNRRAELYQAMADWVRQPTCRLIDDQDLIRELTAPTFTHNVKGQMVLERKDQIAKRLHGRSTDLADALSYTFGAGDIQKQVHGRDDLGNTQTIHEYDPYGAF